MQCLDARHYEEPLLPAVAGSKDDEALTLLVTLASGLIRIPLTVPSAGRDEVISRDCFAPIVPPAAQLGPAMTRTTA